MAGMTQVMRHLIDIADSLNPGEVLPIGLLAGPGLMQGLLVTEDSYEEEVRLSLVHSAQGGGMFSGNDGSVYQYVLDMFDVKDLGQDSSGATVPLTHVVVAMGMMSVEIPAMRVNPKQVVSWWVTEHKAEGARFQGGGAGVAF